MLKFSCSETSPEIHKYESRVNIFCYLLQKISKNTNFSKIFKICEAEISVNG